MKKIFFCILTLVAVLLCSCNKESSFEPKVITISASLDEDTKATFTDAGVFSWEAEDEIAYILRHTDGHYDGNALNTTNSGTTATFTGSTTATNFSAVNLAFYPKNRYQGDVNNNSLNVNNDSSIKTLQASLAGTITARPDRLSRIIPMIGKKTGEDASGQVEHYHFYPVTGVLKVSFTGLPATASQIRLTVPDAATYPLNGTFNIDTERAIPEIKATDVSTGYELKYLNFNYAGSDDTFYIPIPTGTIPAGKLTVSVTDGTNVLYAVTNKLDIELVRGEITELPNIDMTGKSISFTVGGTSNDPAVSITHSGFARVCLNVTNSDDNTPSSYPDGLFFSGNVNNYKISTWDASHTKLLGDKNSGLYYMHYVALTTTAEANTLSGLNDKRVKAYGTVPFYFLSSSDNTAIVGNWTHDTSDGCQAFGTVPTTSNFTLAASTKPTTSNIMVTQFDGLDCKYPVGGIFIEGSGKIELNNLVYFDDSSHYFARTSSEATHLNLIFTDGSKTAFYADYNFGLKDPNWVYYYTASSSHTYTK